MDKLKSIKLVLSDVDGVMTDARVWWEGPGEWRRHFSVFDGYGFIRLQKAGIKTGIITASDSDDVRARFKHLKVDFYIDASRDKLKHLQEIASQAQVELSEIAYIGDDVMDQPVLEKVGFSATVPNGHDPLKEVCDYTTTKIGGYGAVREVCELILKAQGFNG